LSGAYPQPVGLGLPKGRCDLARRAVAAERIARVTLMAEPPSIDANEITDKGYINQRAVLKRRAARVKQLLSEDPAVLQICEPAAAP